MRELLDTMQAIVFVALVIAFWFAIPIIAIMLAIVISVLAVYFGITEYRNNKDTD